MQHVAASSEACKVALQLVDIGAVSEGGDHFKCLLVYAMMSCKICIGSYKFLSILCAAWVYEVRGRVKLHLSRAGPKGALYVKTASAMNTGKATDISSGCQLKTPDVSVALLPVLTAEKARPPRSLNTHINTNRNVVNSTSRVSQVNHCGGGGPSGVLATPPSSYSSAMITL